MVSRINIDFLLTFFSITQMTITSNNITEFKSLFSQIPEFNNLIYIDFETEDDIREHIVYLNNQIDKLTYIMENKPKYHNEGLMNVMKD